MYIITGRENITIHMCSDFKSGRELVGVREDFGRTGPNKGMRPEGGKGN